MSDEIRKVLQEGVTVPTRSIQPDELWKRGRQRRVRRGLTIACASLLVAAATWSFGGTLVAGIGTSEPVEPSRQGSTTTDDAEADHYLFSNVRVEKTKDDQRAKVLFDMEWSGDKFPGVFECTWRVYDIDGQQVGELTDALPLARFDSHVTNADKLVNVDRPGRSADVLCDSERLDSGPDPSYEEADPAPGYD